MKTCFKCKENKTLDFYIKDSSKKDGLRSYCKDCNKIKKSVSYLKNIPAHKKRMKNYYQKNKNKLDEKNKIWLKNNPDKDSKIHKKWRTNNKEKVKDIRLKFMYGISIKIYDEMSRKQNDVCAICKNKNVNGKVLYVDHNHETGKVRGLLCVLCNTGIGYLRENESYMLNAINYLKQHETLLDKKQAIKTKLSELTKLIDEL